MQTVLRAAFAAACLAVPTLPLGAQVMVIGGTVEEHELRPGQRYQGQLQVRNMTDEPQDVRIYPRDYSFEAGGNSEFPDSGTNARSNGGWLTFGPNELLLPPRADGSVDYTVQVPEDGTQLAGTYWSVLMVEAARPAPAPGDDESQRGVGLRTRVRVAVQIATHLLGTGRHDVDLRDATLTADPEEDTVFRLDLVNVGERAYRPEIRLHLYDADGQRVKTLGERRGLLYPGTSLRQTFDMDGLEPGSYEALVTVDTGGTELFGAQIAVTF